MKFMTITANNEGLTLEEIYPCNREFSSRFHAAPVYSNILLDNQVDIILQEFRNFIISQINIILSR